jgi:hypothetical protein
MIYLWFLSLTYFLFCGCIDRSLGGGLSSIFLRLAGTDSGEVANNLLGVLSLAGAGLTGDQHGLILVILEHVTVSLVRHGEQVGWHFRSALAHEHAGHRISVDWQTLVGVDDDAEQARIGLKTPQLSG